LKSAFVGLVQVPRPWKYARGLRQWLYRTVIISLCRRRQ